MRNKILFFSICSVIATSCVTLTKQSGRSSLSFEEISRFSPGRTQQYEILEKIGRPSKIVKDKNSESWMYITPEGSQRASLVFYPNSGVLKSAHWLLQGSEPELNIVNAKGRFPRAHFLSYEGEQSNPHMLSDEIFFKDEKLGVTIVLNDTRQEVELISWFVPETRTPATSPQVSTHYQIGGQ